MAANGLVLAVDIGTSSLKASLIDDRGEVRANARCRFPPGPRLPFHWTDAFDEAVQALAAARGNAGMRDILGISVSGNGPTLVAIDRAGNAGPILLWNDPIPAASRAEAARTGHSIFIPRLSAFKTIFPDSWNNSRFVLSGPEYLLWHLTGNPVTIIPEPRFAEAYWTPESLSVAGLDPSRLAPFVAPGTIVGTTAATAPGASSSERTTPAHYAPAPVAPAPSPASAATGRKKRLHCPLPAGIPVIAGGPDFVVALVGTGTLEAGKACDRAGTSEGLNVCTPVPVSHPAVRTLPSVIGSLWNAAYLLPETGAKFHAWRKESGQANRSYPEIMKGIEENRDDPGRQLVEEIGRSVRAGVRLLRETTGAEHVFALSGGQARNETWNRMKADMTGATFAQMSTPDGELMGDAIIAFTALGNYASFTEAARVMVRVIRYYEPDPAKSRHYEEKFSRR